MAASSWRIQQESEKTPLGPIKGTCQHTLEENRSTAQAEIWIFTTQLSITGDKAANKDQEKRMSQGLHHFRACVMYLSCFGFPSY